MWRLTGIKLDTNLTDIPTDRLLQEYAKYADATARMNYINQRSEFATKDNPQTVNINELSFAMNGIILRAKIKTELNRRGIEPPADA
jgi:hypothetical protein